MIDIRSHIKPHELLRRTATVDEAYRVLSQSRSECAVVMDTGFADGILMRDKLYGLLGSRFGYSVFGRKPVTEIMDLTPLCTEVNLPLIDIITLAMQRPDDKLYDSILITEKNALLGYVSLHDLLKISANRQLRTIEAQAENMMLSKQLVSNIANAAAAVKRNSQTGQTSAHQMLNHTEAAKTCLNTLMTCLSNILHTSEEQVYRMERLMQHTNNMDKFITYIESMSEDVHIMAINASIQAAQIMEANRGFDIVAAQIKTLAGNSKSSSQKIADSITQMNSDIHGVRSLVGSGRVQVLESKESIRKMEEIFDLLFQSIQSTVRIMSDIYQSAETTIHQTVIASETLSSTAIEQNVFPQTHRA